MASLFDRIARPADPTNASPAFITAADPRADDMSRHIGLSRTRVTIDRRLNGIAMRVSVPVEAYQGVCVALKPARSGGFFYEIRLAHRDADLSVTLGEASDDREIWADWRAWAGFFGLPALVERNDGPEAWAPKAAAGSGSAARPQSFARPTRRRRRPGIVTRRARNTGASQVHREAELIART